MHKTKTIRFQEQVQIDEELIPLIKTLRKYGIKSSSSCQGDLNNSGYIYLKYIPYNITSILEKIGLQYWNNGHIIQDFILSRCGEKYIIQFKYIALYQWNNGIKNPLLRTNKEGVTICFTS
jgi:hypothetical protein